MSLTTEQLERRRRGLSATDIPAILGFDPWRSGWAVQASKRGVAPAPEGLLLDAGHALEPVIAQQYCRDNPGLVLTPGTTVEHPQEPLALATPDYLVAPASDPRRTVKALECKAVFGHGSAARWGERETDAVPHGYLVQVQWQLGVLGLPEADVARFYSGRVEYWRIRADPQLFDSLLEVGRAWWERHMVRGEDVPPTGLDLEALKRSLPPLADPEADLDQATADEAALLHAYRDAWARAKEAEAAAREAEARVLARIGPRVGLVAGELKVKFGPVKGAKSTDWKGLAQRLGATPADVEAHTTQKPDTRRVWASWWRD